MDVSGSRQDFQQQNALCNALVAFHERINCTCDNCIRCVDLDVYMAQLRGDLKELKDEKRKYPRN